MGARAPGRWSHGFTLTELLTVIGLVALLVALFFPVASRVRATAASASCLSNLRQVGTAWMASTVEDHSRLPEYTWSMAMSPRAAWNGYWTSTLETDKIAGSGLCPSASDPNPSDATRGYGTAEYAWTGRHESYGTAIRLDARTFREGSYGYNRWLTSGGGYGAGGGAVYLSDLQNPGNVPVFVDCAYADTRPLNGSTAEPVDAPPGLGGEFAAPGKPEHWKFLLARHGLGVNVYRADGSATWVRLEELYLLSWRGGWTPYRLTLPRQ